MKKLYGVIGNPIEHSLSPAMHNDAFLDNRIDAHYLPLKVLEKDLPIAVQGMKALGFSGFNVTIPHKTAIMPLLDRLDPLAEAIGAVNTVVLEDGKWAGYNSDGPGFVRSLKEEAKRDIRDEKVLIIGAGGAAKAIFYSLAAEGIKEIDICNRSIERAESIKNSCPFPCDSHAFEMAEAEAKLSNYTLIIQTTPAGMYPNVNESPLSADLIIPQTVAVDIIYNPYETKFLKQAREKGAIVLNGLGMFIYQGAIAFEKWTGITPDTNRMKKIVTEQLGGNN